MDIHKPRPWHGLREFLKEYAIIVVGVLTALGAEQAVEWLHWRHLAVETEADLAAGLKLNLANVVYWLDTEPCENARLSDLTRTLRETSPQWRGVDSIKMFVDAASQRPFVTPTVIASPQPFWIHDTWENAAASGVLNHMPRERVAQYGVAYRRVDLARTWQTRAMDESRKLSALGFDSPITPQERASYLNTLSTIEYLQYEIRQQARNIAKSADALGIGLTQKDVDDRVDRARKRHGACVTDVKLPIG